MIAALIVVCLCATMTGCSAIDYVKASQLYKEDAYAQALPLDFAVGSAASLLACGAMYLTRKITVKGYPILAMIMPALFNAILVGWELMVYIGGGFWINALYVAIGELAVMLTLGSVLYVAIRRRGLDQRLFGCRD
jgi:uncharacterized membrane protein